MESLIEKGVVVVVDRTMAVKLNYVNEQPFPPI